MNLNYTETLSASTVFIIWEILILTFKLTLGVLCPLLAPVIVNFKKKKLKTQFLLESISVIKNGIQENEKKLSFIFIKDSFKKIKIIKS